MSAPITTALTAQSSASVIQTTTAKARMASILWPAGGRPDNPGIKTMTINAIVAAANPIRWILTRLLGACTATAPGDIASVFFAYDATRRIAAYVRCRTVA